MQASMQAALRTLGANAECTMRDSIVYEAH